MRILQFVKSSLRAEWQRRSVLVIQATSTRTPITIMPTTKVWSIRCTNEITWLAIIWGLTYDEKTGEIVLPETTQPPSIDKYHSHTSNLGITRILYSYLIFRSNFGKIPLLKRFSITLRSTFLIKKWNEVIYYDIRTSNFASRNRNRTTTSTSTSRLFLC